MVEPEQSCFIPDGESQKIHKKKEGKKKQIGETAHMGGSRGLNVPTDVGEGESALETTDL